jgi:PAS domain S-box-containing protein
LLPEFLLKNYRPMDGVRHHVPTHLVHTDPMLSLGASYKYSQYWEIRMESGNKGGNADLVATAREAGQNQARQMSSGLDENVLEMLPCFVWIAGPDGEFEYLSQSILDYTGMTFEELKANRNDPLRPEDRTLWLQVVAEGLRSGKPVERELRIRRSDGVYRWFHSRMRALGDGEGRVIRWYGTTWDIEEQKQAEEALRKSERELRQIISTIPALVFTAKPDGAVDYLSPRIMDYYGLPAEEFYESGWLSLVHPDEAESSRQAWMHSVESGKSYETTHRSRCADGQYRCVQARGEPLRDDDGRILRWYGLLLDVDDQKRAEEALRQSEDEFRRILEAIPAFVLCITSSGRLHYANQRVVEYTGKELQDFDWTQLIHPEDRDAAAQKRLASVEIGVSYENMYRVRRADGQYRWFRIHSEPRRGPDGLVWYGLFFDIDDQKRAEEALRESENSLRQIIETIPAFVFRATPSGEPDYMNQRIVEYTGKALQEVRESGGWAQLVHPDDRDAMLRKKCSCVEKGIPYENTYRFRRADGEYRWFHVRVDPLHGHDGRVAHWYGLFVDIDDQKRAEEALRESENSLRQIIEAIPALVFRTSPGGELDYMNQRIVEYTGKSLQEVREGGRGAQLVHPDDLDALLRNKRSCNEKGISYENIYRFRRADGQYRWFQVRVESLRDQDGRVAHWYGLFADIDDQKRVEEALRKTEHNLRQIIEAIPAFVLRASPSGALDYMNQRMVEYTGKTLLDLGEWGGFRKLVHPDDHDAALRKWRSCVEKEVSFESIYRLRQADGQYRWFQVRMEPLRDQDGRVAHWYGLQIDIDDRKKTEDMLRTTRARLARATQIATVAELSATIAHEINQPLSAIVVNAHALSKWLRNEPPELERAQLIAERIIRDGNSASEVVRSIRSLFKEATPTKESLDINQVITDVVALECDELRKKGITIKIDLEKHLALTLGDPIQIRQVISNLVQNAVDAMESVSERSKLLSICSRGDGANILVDVRDQGSGLESVEKVFEPFFTTKEKGMGMGLAICRSIIEAHDGDLSATTSTEGTTFSITLPVYPTSGPPED